MLKPWFTLTESRRGWAMGGMFGLLSTAFYFAVIDRVHAQFAFQLATFPCFPGLLISENFIAATWVPGSRFQMMIARFTMMMLSCAINYGFWGSYVGFLYRVNSQDYAPHHAKEALANFLFALLVLFISFFGIAYAFGRGVTVQEFSTPLLVLVGSFVLSLVGFASLFFSLVSIIDDSRP